MELIRNRQIGFYEGAEAFALDVSEVHQGQAAGVAAGSALRATRRRPFNLSAGASTKRYVNAERTAMVGTAIKRLKRNAPALFPPAKRPCIERNASTG